MRDNILYVGCNTNNINTNPTKKPIKTPLTER
ncbi:hypothetical protein EZS27_013681 [termite gut metagenome]|uniref:Uncharacterized protein n=1 Tax=termite gut metagenome TaxID=433724 RepID=A0A5J4RX12_9ZZZZ